MPRQSEYTSEEDAIIMATAGEHADVTNGQLREAGFQARSPRQLTNRRQHLKRSNPTVGTAQNAEQLVRQLKRLQGQRAKALKFIADTDEQMARLAEDIKAQTDAMVSDLGVS